MTPYPEYKATNLPWLPQIPAHWDWLMLSQLTEEQCVKNIGCLENNVLSLSYGNIVRKKNIYSGLSPQDFATYQIVYQDNIILRLTDLQNDHRSLRTGLVKEKGIITSAYTCLKVHSNASFVHYLLHAYDLRKVFYGMGGGVRQSIGFKDIRSLRFPVAPVAEQEQIVRYLDSMTAKINKLIRAKKKQIALLQEQKQAIINQAVTKGLNPNAEMKDSGIDWLGQIPAHWALPHLSFLTTKIGSGKTPKGGAEIYQDSGVMFIRSQNVYFNALRTGDIRYISEEINSTMRSTKVCREDVLLNITGGSIGRCCVFRQNAPANVNQHVCIIRCKKNLILPDYLANILFSYIGQNSIMFCQNEGNRESLTFPQIGAFCIPLPQIEEQKDILQYLEIKTKSIDIAVDKIDQEIQVFSELKNSYIASVVTGQVDVRNIQVEDFDPADLAPETDDDPAEEESTEESEVE